MSVSHNLNLEKHTNLSQHFDSLTIFLDVYQVVSGAVWACNNQNYEKK